MSDAVIVAIVAFAVANLVLLLKLVFGLGGVKTSIDTLITAKIPERLITVELQVQHLKEAVEDIRDLTPPPVAVTSSHRR